VTATVVTPSAGSVWVGLRLKSSVISTGPICSDSRQKKNRKILSTICRASHGEGPDTSTGWVETTLTKRTRGFGLGPATGSVAGASALTSWCRAGDGSTIPSRLGRRIVLLGPSLSFLEGSGPRQAGIRTHVATTFGSSVNWTRDQWQTLVLNKTAISEEEFLTLKVTESMIERSGIDKKKKY